MSLRYAFRVLTAVFLIATMLGTGQSFAQEDVPAATPVVDNEDSFETAESTPDQSPLDTESSTLSPQADTSRPFTISGTVTDTNGTPLKDADVCFTLYSPSSSSEKCDVSDENGQYSVDGIPGFSSPRVTVTLDGYWTAEPVFNYFTDQDVTFDVVLQAVAGSVTIAGLVTDTEGEPLAGAEICVRLSRYPQDVNLCQLTGTDGTYSFDNINIPTSTTWILILATMPGYVDTYQGFESLPSGTTHVDFSLSLFWAEQVTVQGVLTDTEGNALAGASIWLNQQCRNCLTASTSTLGDGSFLISDRFDNSYPWVLTIRLETEQCAEFNGLPLDLSYPEMNLGTLRFNCETGEITVEPPTVAETITISGQVTDDQGSPLVGADICIQPTDGARTCVQSGNGGTYSITDVPNGDALLTAGWFESFQWLSTPDKSVTVVDADITVDFVLSPATISGTVVDESGALVPGITVCTVGGGSTMTTCIRTNNQGAFAFIAMHPFHTFFSDDFTWTFTVQGTDENSVSVGGGVNVVLVAVPSVPSDGLPKSAAPLTGTIVDANANPINEFSVCLHYNNRWAGVRCFLSNDETNAFSVHRWQYDPSDPYSGLMEKVTFSAEGCPVFERAVSDDAPLPEDGVMGTITLDCEVGVVTPTETVTPTDVPTETPAVIPTQTVEPTQTVTATVTPTESPVSGNTLIVTINLPDGASIEGVPYNLYAEQASIQFQTEPIRSGVVGASNTIEINDLLPGTYKLVISPEGMAPIEAIIQIGDQPLTEIRLTVHEDGSVSVGDSEATATTVPTETATSKDVSGFPNTGAGTGNTSMGAFVMLAVAGCALLTAGGLAMRQRRG